MVQAYLYRFLGIGSITADGFIVAPDGARIPVPRHCRKPDYYFKTFHHDRYWSATPRGRRKRFCVDGAKHLDHNEFHDNIFCIDPEETIAFMRSVG